MAHAIPPAVRSLRVEPATAADLPAVRAAYAEGRATQRAHGSAVWPDFADAAILAEIGAGNLLRVLDGAALGGVFSVAHEDPAIWGERERGAHVYLHRIARAAGVRAPGLVGAVLDWARERCRSTGREGLRMDTWADNAALVAYYERLGFALVGRRRLGADPRLPPHYHGVELALLEFPVAAAGRSFAADEVTRMLRPERRSGGRMEPRLATMDDVSALNALIAASARALSVGFYTPAQVEALVAHVFGVDTQLIADGTYYVIDAPGGTPAAAGGWSARRTLYGGDQMKGHEDPRLDPASDPARIRAFFVHPDWARRGLARRLYEACAAAAAAAGYGALELMATLPGEPLYRALGFEAGERVEAVLPGGVVVPLVRMGRPLAARPGR